jgi:hypothetical protein
MLLRTYSEDQKVLNEEEALHYLRGERFFVDLRRCFPRKSIMDDAQRQIVAQAIIHSPFPRGKFVDTSDTSQPLTQLVRAGVLSGDGTFTCLLAQSLYFNTFYNRPTTAPKSLNELICLSVGSMSALRLSQACGSRELPKEAAFQQLFNEAMTLLLPPNVAVHPELNTFAQDASGSIVSGELDFFIDGPGIKWAIELLVGGDKINEHVGRFDPNVGKYRLVGYDDYVIVDCRGPRARAVKSMDERCTLYFSDDYKTVEVKMRRERAEQMLLQD